MITHDRFVNAFGITPPGNEDELVRVIKGAVKSGFAVVLNHPGTKRPLCTLTARQANTADKEAMELARSAGHPRWDRVKHACGLAHALTDPAVADRTARRLIKMHGRLNLGVQLAQSRVLVVDVDTPVERDAFLSYWQNQDGPDSHRGFTVTSPGAQDESGIWVHKDGGHFYFEVPADWLPPAGAQVLKHPDGWVAMWGMAQVLVPPSVRPEGAYHVTGQSYRAPGWLLDVCAAHSATVAARRERGRLSVEGGSDIDAWAAATPWEALLGPDGWSPTGLVDTCSCPVWTAPGGHASLKSATAHDLGCSRFDQDGGHAPLHVWTDNPPDFLIEYCRIRKTLTKLTYVALRDHEGDNTRALRALGLIGTDTSELPSVDWRADNALPVATEPPPSRLSAPETSSGLSGGDATDPFGDPGTPSDLDVSSGFVTSHEDSSEETEPEEAPPDPVAKLIAEWLTADELDAIADPDPLVTGVLDLDTLTRMIGKSGHGKSFLALDLGGHIATGQPWAGKPVRQGRVCYVVAEGARGFKRRIKAWQDYHDIKLEDQFLILPRPVQVTDSESWRILVLALHRLKPSFVVLDTQARITVGAEENSARDMGIVVERCEQIRRATGACVMLVHHLGHKGDEGRGSTAMLGAETTEILVKKDKDKRIEVTNPKQKDAEEFAPIYFDLTSHDNSAVLVPLDPFEAIEEKKQTVVMGDVPEDADLAIKIARVLYFYGSTRYGLTRTAIRDFGMESFGSEGWSKSQVSKVVKKCITDELLEETSSARVALTPKGYAKWELDPSEAGSLAGTPTPAGPDDDPEES